MSRQADLISSIRVAAGILIDANDHILVAERVGGGSFQGMWEFPGGKIEQGERTEDALIREIREELGIQVIRYEPFMQLNHEYPDRSVELSFFSVMTWTGVPVGMEGQALKWVSRTELGNLELLPADQPVVDALQKQMASA